jgi:hypothetical protein
LNPVENVWAKLKDCIYELHPALQNKAPANQAFKSQFLAAIDEA